MGGCLAFYDTHSMAGYLTSGHSWEDPKVPGGLLTLPTEPPKRPASRPGAGLVPGACSPPRATPWGCQLTKPDGHRGRTEGLSLAPRHLPTPPVDLELVQTSAFSFPVAGEFPGRFQDTLQLCNVPQEPESTMPALTGGLPYLQRLQNNLNT